MQQVTMHNANPAVCVKVYDPMPSDKVLRAVAHDHGYDPDDFVGFFATLSDDMFQTYVYDAAENAFELAQDDAAFIFAGHSPKVYQEGRWLVVHGLPNIETWDDDMLTCWRKFETYVDSEVRAFPESLATLVAINAYDIHLTEQEADRRYHGHPDQ